MEQATMEISQYTNSGMENFTYNVTMIHNPINKLKGEITTTTNHDLQGKLSAILDYLTQLYKSLTEGEVISKEVTEELPNYVSNCSAFL
jgi:predicted HAD superfamily Cof-like phosphohydrolase